jgi:hypothetical protein
MIFKWVVFELAPHRNSCILNNNVQFLTFFLQHLNQVHSSIFYLLKLCHIQFYDLNILTVLAVVFNSFQLVQVSCWKNQIGFRLTELISQILADTRRSACNPNSFIFVVGLGKFSLCYFKYRISNEDERYESENTH